MKFRLWLTWRYLKGGRTFFSLHQGLSVLAMAIGVACLVVAMAIVSGFESTLKNTLIDSFGHLVLIKRGESIRDVPALVAQVKEQGQSVEALSPFLLVEAIAAKGGKIQGVLLEGVDPESHPQVVNMGRHIVEGSLDLGFGDSELPGAVVGRVLQQRLGLVVGEPFRVVIPVTERFGGDRFRPRALTIRVAGVADLGRYDFDERYILVSLDVLQKFSHLKGAATGLRLRLSHEDLAQATGDLLVKNLGFDYVARTWFDSNRNLFEAIEYERPVIFLIVCLIVVAAGFSVSGSLYVSVLRRYRDISVLKTLGAGQRFIRQLFSTQGLFIGFLGSALGVLLGQLLCLALMKLQQKVELFPGDVYRIDHVILEVRSVDVAGIFLVSLLICFLASLAPARRGARLSAVEGLRYE